MGFRKMSLEQGSWGDFPVGGIEAGISGKRSSVREGDTEKTSEDSRWAPENPGALRLAAE